MFSHLVFQVTKDWIHILDICAVAGFSFELNRQCLITFHLDSTVWVNILDSCYCIWCRFTYINGYVWYIMLFTHYNWKLPCESVYKFCHGFIISSVFSIEYPGGYGCCNIIQWPSKRRDREISLVTLKIVLSPERTTFIQQTNILQT